MTPAGSSVGFGGESLWGTWTTDRRCADAVEVRALAAKDGESVALLAVCDFGALWPSHCQRIRATLADALHLPMGSIGIFATQNHGVEGSYSKGFDLAGVERAILSACRQALSALQPAEMSMVAVRPDPPLNVCRRIHWGEFGAFTFYFGYRVDEQGRADVSHIVKAFLTQMAGGERFYPVRSHDVAGRGPEDYEVPEAPIPVPTPFYLPPPPDGLIQALFFRAPDGRPIGSVLRFATHPNTANREEGRKDMDWVSGDYPVYARRRLEEAFGGTGMFLTGPCGDSCPLIGRKSRELAEKVGRQVADAALAALPGASWGPASPVRAFCPQAQLRIRDDYPASVEEARQSCGELEAQVRAILAEERAVGAPKPGAGALARIKRLLDRWEAMLYIAQGSMREWTGEEFAGRAGQTLTHPL